MRISDDELRARLGAHSYPVPPITDSTRGVLLKKLQQLDSGRRVPSARRSTPLFDYSSAEEDEAGAGSVAEENSLHKRKGSTQSLNNGRQRHQRKKTPNGGGVPTLPGAKGRMSTRSLLSHSEEEESEEVEEEEESEESEEEEDIEDIEEEESNSSRRDQQHQHQRRGVPSNASNQHRFASSTPLSTIRSTASYLEEPSPPKSKADFSPLSSPTLRKQIASNKDSFGSLGEALSSLPSSTSSPSPSLPSRPHLFSNGGGSLSSMPSSVSSSSLPSSKSSGSILTQASPGPQKDFATKRSSFCNSHSISKIIIVLAGIFFSGIAFKYSHLRPNPNILNRIVICQENNEKYSPCVSEKDAEAFKSLHMASVAILEDRGVEALCGGSTTAALRPANDSTRFSYPVESLFAQLSDENDDSLLERALFDRFMDLLAQNPQWGLLVSGDGKQIELYNPPIDWSCWLSLKIGLTYSLLLSVMSWVLRIIFLLFLCYGVYRWRLWYAERRLRENQDVFELVEHVLSILATQNTLVLREGRSSPSIAINHIRDQLISPQDRDKKRKLWEKVVSYIRKSESRVREGTQKMYGEEVEVWQWIPDIRWGHAGPNPYVPGVAAANVSPGQWQGSAFSSLNKNVAAPMVAPTSCLKVRHMFDRSSGSCGNARWVWQVKEEILRRCSGSATILHIAVDQASSEGCVYIKTSNTDGAGAVFRCLHGQWYRGNLVTVKYLREERYMERFPDSRLARTPLLPQIQPH